MTDSTKLAGRLAPVIRRGLIVGEANSVSCAVIAERASDMVIWSAELTKESDPDVLANECACIAIEEGETGRHARFRLDALKDGLAVATLVFRTKAESKSDDPVGDALHRAGDTIEVSMLRQQMRHNEMLTRVLVQNTAAREEGMVRENARLAARVTELETKAVADAQRHIESLREERMADLLLLEQDAKNEAIKEGIALVKRYGPRLVARLTGADKLSPVAEVLRGMTGEQITALEASGLVNKEQAKAVRDAWQLLQEEPKPKALPANGSAGAGKAPAGKAPS